MTVISRIELLRLKKCLTKRAFSIEIGIKDNVYASAVGKSSNVSGEMISKVAVAYPDVNLTWLLTGDGEMYTTNTADVVALKAALTDCQKTTAKYALVMLDKDLEIKNLKSLSTNVSKRKEELKK